MSSDHLEVLTHNRMIMFQFNFIYPHPHYSALVLLEIHEEKPSGSESDNADYYTSDEGGPTATGCPNDEMWAE